MATTTPIERKFQNALERLHLFPTSRAYIAASSGLIISAFLLFPGNPVWDWSITRIPNIVFIYINFLLLSSAVFIDRHTLLRKLVNSNPARRATMFIAALSALFSLFFFLYIMAPAYLQSISREHGLVEPLNIFLYFIIAITGTEHFKAIREKNLNYRPYKLLAIIYTALMFEECDWLGIFGAVFGRIDGVYLGAIHDIANLLYKNQHRNIIGFFIVIVIITLLITLWRKRYLTADFLKRELADFSTIYIYIWFILNVLAGIYDIDGNLLIKFNVPGFPEEALELSGTFFLFIATTLKYCRDIPRKPA